ncbi:MAG: thiolase family protein [Clostridia bacterium]|nr:thiolase family protein [Clostridia bacterium]
MSKALSNVVVVAYGRSPVGRAYKGSLKNLHPVDLGAQVLKGVLARVPKLDPKDIDDIVVGCARPQDFQGNNIARLVALRAGVPYTVSAQTINRFCSSGLQAIATAANAIAAGQADVVVAGGVEMMSYMPSMKAGSTSKDVFNEWLAENIPGVYMPMGITAENVAAKYNVSRQAMDELAVASHKKAAAAQETGKFDDQIIPIEAIDDEGKTITVTKDEGIRPNSTVEKLAALTSPFKADGKVTAGTSSQTSDGAGFVVLMSKEKADELGIAPIAKFLGFATGGVEPHVMGLGPIAAVPKVFKITGLSMKDIDVIELNEAFAAQAIPVMDELSMPREKVNPNGGAMAMGHPLGATGAVLTCKALSELKRTNGKYGLVTMCIGGGMGAAGIYEMC